jgi:hypothetical protein
MLDPFVGISYQVGRAISILSAIGVMVLFFRAVVPRIERSHRVAGYGGAIAATGLFAAFYPWMDAWYDIARGDTLFLVMIVGGVAGVHAWARASYGWRGHGRLGLAAALLALSFFCKQTGVFFVMGGGAVVLVINWRRLPTYVGVAAAIGLGGTWLINRATGGWFWTYVFEVHQTHDCHPGRFKNGFTDMLGKYPAMTATIAVALLAVLAASIKRRRLPRSAAPLLVWSWMFAVGLVVGAVGIATQWSHRNAYLPGMVAGAMACAAALPAMLGAGEVFLPERRRRWAWVAPIVAMMALALTLLAARWSPRKYLPTERDRVAGARLIEQIRAVEGEVFVPFHPWYAHLAGKRVYTHRMGVMDLRYSPPMKRTLPQCFFHDSTGRKNWEVAGLPEAFDRAYFAAIFWDNRDLRFFEGMRRHYRLDERLTGPKPRLFTGATDLTPNEIWVPAKTRTPPRGAISVFEFEGSSYGDGWSTEGGAWGGGPSSGPIAAVKQGPVRGYTGRYFATSMHGGDGSMGVLTSPPFIVRGERLAFKLSGGVEDRALHDLPRDDSDRPWLRAELVVEGQMVRWAAKQDPPSERMEEVEWLVPEFVGKEARLVVVDQARGSWGHLNVDELWMFPE